jgi:uncharacterized protein involved in outer membrane biogenesis
VAAGDSGMAGERRRSWRRWPKWIVLFVLCVWLVDVGISLLVQHTPLKAKLTARLGAAFGRPVEVGSYDFSLWGGPTLEARSVQVGEDPRFGHEYFLRAESLGVRLRWRSLLQGHLELGTLSLSHPSLNLVRNAYGDWNLGEWLPRPAGSPLQNGPVGPARQMNFAARFRKIEVEGGRVNFKDGDEKLAFAFANVQGDLEAEATGRWRIDLDATPSRAAVILQQAGTLHLAGHVGGTSSRLRPAKLELSWNDASITDVLRLTRSYDYGVHGTLGVSLAAHTEGDAWMVEGRAELRQLHRWDLALRTDNPSLNLIAKGKLDLAGSRLELTQAMLEAPNSSAQAIGAMDWSRPRNIREGDSSGTRLEVTSSGISLSDVLAWLRAFHSDAADDLSLRGLATGNMTLRGWPPQLEHGAIVIESAQLDGKELRAPVHLGSAALISFGSGDAGLRIESTLKMGRAADSSVHVAGSIAQARDILATARALGWDISRGWDFGGPLRCDLRWVETGNAWDAQPAGTLDWGGEAGSGSLRAPFLNQPMDQIKVHADFKAGDRRVAVSAGQAFGAHWTGSFDRHDPVGEWEFALSADRLSGADLDLWLNPRWRESFLNRMLPFLNPRPGASVASSAPSGVAAEALRATGRLSLGELSLAPYTARHVQGDLIIEGRRVEFANATGQFYGGNVSGSFDAGLVSPPAYHMSLKFSAVDLSALTAVSPGLANLFAGSASGEVSFHARGASRADLIASLECSGTARVGGAELRALNLAESLQEMGARPGTSAFREAAAAFSCAQRKIEFRELSFSGPGADIDAAGSIDFSRNLDLRMQMLPAGASAAPRVAKTSGAPAGEQAFHVTGVLSAPQIARIAAAIRPR